MILQLADPFLLYHNRIQAPAGLYEGGYRGAIERFAKKYGDLPVAKMRRQDVQAILSTMSATPAAANMTLKMIRVLMRRAFDLGLRETDPTLKPRKLSGGEWRSSWFGRRNSCL